MKKVKITKKDKDTYNTFGPPRPNGTRVCCKVFTTSRFNKEIPGWVVIKRTKIKKGRTIIYCTYYESSNVVQDFIDRIDYIKTQDKTIVEVHQVDNETGKVIEDPAEWPIGLMLLTNKPFNEEFENWEITRGPTKCNGLKNTWNTIYRTKEETWDDLINCIKGDKELNRMVEIMIPDLHTYVPIARKVKNRRYDIEHKNKRRINPTVTSSGVKATKYEYPPDCTTKAQRRKFRVMMRKKNKKN